MNDSLQAAAAEEGKSESIAPYNLSEVAGTVASVAALAELFEAVDPLRELLEKLDWQPPQIVVMGNENTGKSTLLERICMMPLFPIDKRIW
jgi:predicted ATPase